MRGPLTEALEHQSSSFKALGCPSLIADYILLYGTPEKQGVKRPQGVRKQAYKECYRNATRYVLFNPGSGFEYFEGYAMSGLGIPMMHAWCERDGRVLDLTWRDPENCFYKGIRVPAEILRDKVIRARAYGVLVDQIGCPDYEFMSLIEPRVADIVENYRIRLGA